MTYLRGYLFSECYGLRGVKGCPGRDALCVPMLESIAVPNNLGERCGRPRVSMFPWRFVIFIENLHRNVHLPYDSMRLLPLSLNVEDVASDPAGLLLCFIYINLMRIPIGYHIEFSMGDNFPWIPMGSIVGFRMVYPMESNCVP